MINMDEDSNSHEHHHHHFSYSPSPYVTIMDDTSEIEIYSNLSNTEDEDDYLNFTTAAILSSSASSNDELDAVYTIAIPIMLIFCFITVIVNIGIVLSARWCRRPMSPTLYYSISLALADASSTFIVGMGLILNSLLPEVYNIKLETDCYSLTLEAFRLGGILVANIHLLALAINHWIGIVRPLQYASTMTRKTAWIIIIFSWMLPNILMFILFSFSPNRGFRSYACKKWGFLEQVAFRALFASLFFAPLILMSFIYIHIFSIVRNHQNHPLQYQNTMHLRRNLKAVVTTVLILGTYILGFLPATLYNVIVCQNCSVYILDVPQSARISVGILVNTLVILKALVDPIIYAARMADIQLALRKMKYDFLKYFCSNCADSINSPEIDRVFSRKYGRSSMETKSVRASSVGSSNASWKKNLSINSNRNAEIANNLQNNIPNNCKCTSTYEMKALIPKHKRILKISKNMNMAAV